MIEKDVFIPLRVTSMNKIKGHHWSMYHKKERKRWATGLLVLGWGDHQGQRRYLRIISYQPSRGIYDPDNHKTGCKPILDGLKEMGWIKEDRREWVEVEYAQRKVGEDGTTEVGTRIILFYPGKFPGSYLCSACFEKLFQCVEQNIASEQQENYPGGPGVCSCCGREAELFVRLQVWRVDNARRKKKKKTSKATQKTE